jgi:hypothetical protein
MDKISDLFKKNKTGELILIVIFIIYLIMGLDTPSFIGNYVNTLFGKLFIIIIVIGMFLNTNPFLAILSLLVGFELIRRSSPNNIGINALQKYAPSEDKKMSQFTAYNQFPYTLEQEVVKKMAPIKHFGTTLSKASYKPFLENLYDASPLNGTN